LAFRLAWGYKKGLFNWKCYR